MSEIHSQENSTTLISAGDNYELKHILNAAAAYLDSGKVDDAEDLLHEAIEVGADHPDVEALARRLDHARGRSRTSTPAREERLAAVPDVLVNFTRPLPGAESQTPGVQHLVRDSESHYMAKRFSAALDSSYLTCVEAPGYLPGFVRLAEIQLALGNSQRARDLFETLSYWHEIHDQEPDWLVESLRISLNPGDTTALSDYASSLLDTEGSATLEPFVPQAITRSIGSQPEIGLDLSKRYLERCPDSIEAQRLHLRVLMASGDVDTFSAACGDIVVSSSPVDLLALRTVAESLSNTDDWLAWAETIAVSIRSDRSAHTVVEATIQDAGKLMTPERFAIFSGVAAFSAGQWQECADRLRSTSASSQPPSIESFVEQVMLALALNNLNDPDSGTVTMDAVKTALHPEIEGFAHSTQLFGVSVTAGELLKSAVGRDGNAIDELQALRDANPTRLELRSALAELYLDAGNPHEAVRELRYVAQEHERSGNLPEMVQAMRQISSAVPGNVEIKAKLIEGYLRRGVLDDAVLELGKIGELYVERGKETDAVAAFTRGAEIAAAIGAFTQGNALFQRAVEATPDDVPVRHAAVAFYLQTGSIAQATDQLREVVRIVLLTEDLDEAVAALHQIIALAPEDPDSYHKLGEVLTAMGEYTQAERVYRRLATFSPHDPVLEAKQSALAVLAATK